MRLFYFILVIVTLASVHSKTHRNPLLEYTSEARIVNGIKAAPYEFPWLVEIRYQGRHICGGTILNKHFVVTAAHCMNIEDTTLHRDLFQVYIHEHNIHCAEGDEEHRDVLNIQLHEDYDFVTVENDVAVLRVTPPFLFNRYVKPIPGLTPAGFDYKGMTAVVAGWGHLFPYAFLQRQRPPGILRKVALHHYPVAECRKGYNKKIKPESMVCFGGEDKGSCQGDSGGGLICRQGRAPPFLCGIVSWAIRCGDPERASVFVRLPKFVSWITHYSEIGTYAPIIEKCGRYLQGSAAIFNITGIRVKEHCHIIIESPYEEKTFLMIAWHFLPEDEVFFIDTKHLCNGCKPIKFNHQKPPGSRSLKFTGSSTIIISLRISALLPLVDRKFEFEFTSKGKRARLYPLTGLRHLFASKGTVIYPKPEDKINEVYYYNNANVLFVFTQGFITDYINAEFDIKKMDVKGGPGCTLDRLVIFQLNLRGEMKQEAVSCTANTPRTLSIQTYGLLLARFVSTSNSKFGRGFEFEYKLTPSSPIPIQTWKKGVHGRNHILN